MEGSIFYKKQDSKENFTKKEPLTKAFSEGKLSDANLPYEIKTDPKLIKECKERKESIKKLNSVYLKIPILTNIEDALEKNLIQTEEIEDFYKSIINLIEKDKDSKRLLLYFPLELIPEMKNEKLKFFSEFYKNNWKDLLKEIDLREDFNIGDVPEKEIRVGGLAKISKAAHLIPFLIEKNIINKNDVFNILENGNEKVLIESTLDTLRILAEKKYLNIEDIKRLENSKNVDIRNTAKMIQHDQTATVKDNNIENVHEKLNIREFFNSMNRELNINEEGMFLTDKLPENRKKWLTGIEKEKIIKKYSEILYIKISKEEYEINTITEDKNLNTENIQAFIKTIETLIIENSNNENYWQSLNKLKKRDDVNIKNSVLNTLNRLNSINITNENYFSKRELDKDKKETEKSVENKIKNILSKIEKDPLLGKIIYPLGILQGSHIKGYGKENSDIDLGVFIKENVNFEKHNDIKNAFSNILKESNIKGSIMEFWLKKENNYLWIQDFDNPDHTLGDSLLTAPITGSWYGDEKSISFLQKELIPKYLYSENKHIFGFNARKIWLKDIEHNLIQYRLMHKGYKENSLEQGGINSKYKEEIDGESMFYDSGFRRSATKIYLEKVFLPQLKK
ncbi:MAG: hypothetical protein WCO35_02715 [Candidatus Nomurabacteria bacterium]